MQKLASGKRSLLVLDFSEAVTSLSEACQMLGEHYGETAMECGEPYFLYGRALLDLARAEAGVIDNGLDGGKITCVYVLSLLGFFLLALGFASLCLRGPCS